MCLLNTLKLLKDKIESWIRSGLGILSARMTEGESDGVAVTLKGVTTQ